MGDLNRSIIRLQNFDLEELEDVEGSQAIWMSSVKRELKVESEHQLTAEKFMGPTKKYYLTG